MIDGALSRIEQVADRWRPRRGGELVRLSLLPSFAKRWLLPRMAALQGDPPSLQVELLIEHRQSDLEAREADLVIRYGRGAWPGIDAQLLFHEDLAPAASPMLAARIGAGASAAEIARHPLIHDSDTRQWRDWLAAAEAGLGVCLIRLPFAEDWLTSGKLVLLSERRSRNPASHFLGLRHGETRPAVLEFAKRMNELCS